MESGIQIGLSWSGSGLSSGAGSGQSLSTSSSLRSYVSFKDLKDAWEVKSTSSSSKGGPSHHASPLNQSWITLNSAATTSLVSSVKSPSSDQFPSKPPERSSSKPPKRSYPNNLYGQKGSRGDTASSTASSSFPKSNYNGNKGGKFYKGDKVKMKRGDLAREFDKVVLASKAKGHSNKGNETINKNRGNNINSNIRTNIDPPTNHQRNKTSQLQNDLLSLMRGNPSMVHSLASNLGPCDICYETNHPTLRCRMLTDENLKGGMQKRLEVLKKELEMQSVERLLQHVEAQHNHATAMPPKTTAMQQPTRQSSSLLVNTEETMSAQGTTPLATTAQSPSARLAATPQSRNSQGPHLLASPQSSSQLPQAPLDATHHKAIPAIPISPNPETTAPKELSAFLTSPTGMNWEDLVRSMKPKKEPETLLDLLNKTIVVDEEDDVSELGSMDGRGHDRRVLPNFRSTSDLGHGRDGKKGYAEDDRGYIDMHGEADRERKGFVGDLEMMGNVIQEVVVRHQDDSSRMGDSSKMDDVLGSVVTVRHGQHDDVSEEEHSSISSKSTFHKHRRTTKSLLRESLEKKVERVLTGRVGCSNQDSVLTGKKLDASLPEKKRSNGGQHAKNQPQRQPSEGKRIPRITPLPPPPPNSRSQSFSPREVSPRIGSGTSSAFSILKTPSKQLSPTTPGTAVETTFSSFEHSEATLSPLSSPNLPKNSSSETSFSPIEPCISPNQLLHSHIVTPQPRSPRASKARSCDRDVAQQRTWSPQRRPQQQRGRSSSVRGSKRGPQNVNVAPRVLSVAERRRAERHRHQRERQQGVSSSPCDDPPIVMNISTDEITISPPPPPQTEEARLLYAALDTLDDPPIVMNISTDEVTVSPPPPRTEEERLLYAALDTLDKNATTAEIINNNDTAIPTKNHQGKTMPSRQERQKRRESLSDPPLLPMSTTEENSHDNEEEEESANAPVNANDNNSNNERGEVAEDDNFYYHIRGMNPLFGAEDDDDVEDAVEASVEDGAGGGEDIDNNGNISNGNVKNNNKDKEATHFPTHFENNSAVRKSGIENNNDCGEERPMLPAGFDAVAAAAAAKQRVEQQAATTADNNDSGGSKKKAATNDRLPTSTATTTTDSASACTTITAALCAGLWNGGNSNAGDGDNAPPPQQAVEVGGDDGAICILPQSLFIHRKAPTCWQVFGHRLRKTKGEF